jgi:hypothetical protein
MRVRGIVIGTVALGVVASACGSSGNSTGFKGPTATQLESLHLDTLAQAAAAESYFDRFRLIEYPMAAMSENVGPASVTVTVDGTAQTYSALGLDIVYTDLTSVPSESLFVIVAWSDANVDELVYGQLGLPNTLEDWADLSDSVANTDLNTSTAELSASLVNASGTCHSIALGTPNALVASGVTCNSGTINGGFNFTFTPDSTNPHSTFVLETQDLPAARLVIPTTGGQSKIPIARLAKLAPVIMGGRRL